MREFIAEMQRRCGYDENDKKIADRPTVSDALRALVAANNCNYDREAMRSEGLFTNAEKALARIGS
jgi:hypothetical protein